MRGMVKGGYRLCREMCFTYKIKVFGNGKHGNGRNNFREESGLF